MKKTLVALSILAAATSVSAAEVYNNNGVTLSVNGDLDVHYIKAHDVDTDAELAVDDADFGFGLAYDVNQDFTVGGALNIDGDNGSDNEGITVDEAFVGFMTNGHTLTFGKQYTIRDDSGIGSDYEFGLSGAVENSDFYGSQVVKYVYDNGEMFYAGASYSAYENGSNGRVDGDKEFDVRLGLRVADFDFTSYIGSTDKGVVQEDHYILEGRYTINAFELAATYAWSTESQPNATDIERDVIGLAATYTVNEKVTLAAGYSIFGNDIANSDDVNQGYLNGTYNFSSNVWTYAEVGFTDAQQTNDAGETVDQDTAFVIGMGVSF
ncbi:porin [Vibrio sp. LaRot3]|uniref:porin n=1 Tax=Vibrio sp. LaRot3 TaxID=2998829 RepID=UPI0022CE2CFD|nr:porin [Vibrio sp. LaRot3]MDA0147271.1 porin [Vibrio sp. LaRot3]